jgi:type III secretory pathway component EscT
MIVFVALTLQSFRFIPIIQPGNFMTSSDDIIRLKKQEQIFERIQDIAKQDPVDTAVTLLNLSLALIAKSNPPDNDAVDLRKIKENYPDATAELISERSMSEEGLAITIASAIGMANIAIDYSPLSHAAADIRNDDQHQQYIHNQLGPTVKKAFDDAVKNGVSPFGSAATIILLATVKSMSSGMSPFKTMRPLIDAMSMVLSGGPSVSEQDQEEQAIRSLMQIMNISRKQAMKYAEAAKRMSPRI